MVFTIEPACPLDRSYRFFFSPRRSAASKRRTFPPCTMSSLYPLTVIHRLRAQSPIPCLSALSHFFVLTIFYHFHVHSTPPSDSPFPPDFPFAQPPPHVQSEMTSYGYGASHFFPEGLRCGFPVFFFFFHRRHFFFCFLFLVVFEPCPPYVFPFSDTPKLHWSLNGGLARSAAFFTKKLALPVRNACWAGAHLERWFAVASTSHS